MFLRLVATLPVLAVCAFATSVTNEAIFREAILPVLNKNCASCHSGAAPRGALSLSAFGDLLKGGKHGSAIIPGRASESLLIQYVRGEKSPKMPLGGELPSATVTSLMSAIDRMEVLKEKPKDAYATWLFETPKRPASPRVLREDWVKNPIDAFILAKLEAKGLTPAPSASPRALIRRIYFDLIGLPPTPEEVQAFVNDASPKAYEAMIDKLLADDRYGERWGRHWLDLVRYAESDGFAIDSERPTAWRYRDYVIRSFNKDKPYDLFVMEQLAGDELTDKRATAEDRSDRLIALGYLRMGTWEADANFKTQLRQDFLNEITTTTTQVFLGITVGCARCHDHKYDPIPQRDFYRMQAFFAATRVDDKPAAFLPVENPGEMKRLNRLYEDESEMAGERLKEVEARLKQKYVEAKHLKVDDKAAGDFRKALKDRKDPIYSEEERKAFEEAVNRSRRLTDSVPRYRPVAYSVSDVVPPQVPSVAETYVLAGGELAARGDKVEPGFLQCVTGKPEPAKIPFAGGSSGRRLALAEWIAGANNPLTARVLVNRMWQHHFGEGILRTSSDFGMNGDRPSHPELLDWLATEFVDKKWSIKAMHKLMLMSNTYRQSTEHPEFKKYADVDPNNQLLWRMNWLRLEAETVRDSILATSGRLQKTHGGPGVFINVPADVAEGFEFFKWFPSEEKDQRRRTVYTFQRRSVMSPMIEVFDGANMSESCSRRNVTTVAPQAFTLLNGELTNREATHFAERVIEDVGPNREKQIERAFWLALNRAPTAAEVKQAGSIALPRLAVVLFNLNEFIYLE